MMRFGPIGAGAMALKMKPLLSVTNIGPQVRARIGKKGLSISKLAKLIGMQQPHLSRLLAGPCNPTASKLIALASALECRVDDLLAP